MKVGFVACAGWLASAVAAAAELGIADRVEAKPQTASELASATRTSEAVLLRVLRALAAFDLFKEDARGRFSNTPDSRELLSAHPQSMRYFCMMAATTYQQPFTHLMHSLKTGEPATIKAFGEPLYQHMDRVPAEADIYDRAMEDLGRASASALAASRKVRSGQTVVDIGGGRGVLLKTLLRADRSLRGACLDRPSVCERAAADLAATDPHLASRLEYRGGDFFESPIPTGDVYVLKNVLQNWNDDSASTLLQRVRDAAVVDGRRASVMVLEALKGGPMPSLYQRMDDLVQIVICERGTAARTESEFHALFDRSGLEAVASTTLPTGQVLLEATPRI